MNSTYYKQEDEDNSNLLDDNNNNQYEEEPESFYNPDEEKLSWNDFKSQYYVLENQVKQETDNLSKISINFSKIMTKFEQDSNECELGILNGENDATFNNSNNKNQNYQQRKLERDQRTQDFENQYQKTMKCFKQMTNLLDKIEIDQKDQQKFMKTKMLNRFKEINQENEKEINRINNIMDFHKKKLELFKGSDLSNLKMDNELDFKTKSMLQENSQLKESVSITGDILQTASGVTRSFSDQKSKFEKISHKVKQISESAPGIGKLVEKIKWEQNKNDIILSSVIAVCILIILYKIFG